MYGPINEGDFVFVYCDDCHKKVNINDVIEKYSKIEEIMGFDGVMKPRLKLYCKECGVKYE